MNTDRHQFRSLLVYPCRFGCLLILMVASPEARADPDPIASLFSHTTIASNQTYRSVDSHDLKLDVYVPATRLGEPPWVEHHHLRRPTLLYFHGGGWRGGDRISRSLQLLPYVAREWVVVTADYRLLSDATLPEIVGDCRAALHWVADNAERFPIDLDKIVLSGNSAGGHLALMTGLVKDDACYALEGRRNAPKVAAIINWYGITDVEAFAGDWSDKQILSGDLDRLESVYKSCSPIKFLGEQTPPIMSIHGTRDPVVGFEHADRLHQLLEQRGLPHELFPVENRKHGDFSAVEMTQIFEAIWAFLTKHNIE